jgi:hypothetical protein
MKVKYEFEPDDYDSDDRDNIKIFQQADKSYWALWEMREYLMKKHKHVNGDEYDDCKTKYDAAYQDYEEIFDKFFEILEDKNVNFEV